MSKLPAVGRVPPVKDPELYRFLQSLAQRVNALGAGGGAAVPAKATVQAAPSAGAVSRDDVAAMIRDALGDQEVESLQLAPNAAAASGMDVIAQAFSGSGTWHDVASVTLPAVESYTRGSVGVKLVCYVLNVDTVDRVYEARLYIDGVATRFASVYVAAPGGATGNMNTVVIGHSHEPDEAAHTYAVKMQMVAGSSSWTVSGFLEATNYRSK